MNTDNKEILFEGFSGETKFIVYSQRGSNGRRENGSQKEGNKYYALKSRPGKRNLVIRINRSIVDQVIGGNPERSMFNLFQIFRIKFKENKHHTGGIGLKDKHLNKNKANV